MRIKPRLRTVRIFKEARKVLESAHDYDARGNRSRTGRLIEKTYYTNWRPERELFSRCDHCGCIGILETVYKTHELERHEVGWGYVRNTTRTRCIDCVSHFEESVELAE